MTYDDDFDNDMTDFSETSWNDHINVEDELLADGSKGASFHKKDCESKFFNPSIFFSHWKNVRAFTSSKLPCYFPNHTSYLEQLFPESLFQQNTALPRTTAANRASRSRMSKSTQMNMLLAKGSSVSLPLLLESIVHPTATKNATFDNHDFKYKKGPVTKACDREEHNRMLQWLKDHPLEEEISTTGNFCKKRHSLAIVQSMGVLPVRLYDGLIFDFRRNAPVETQSPAIMRRLGIYRISTKELTSACARVVRQVAVAEKKATKGNLYQCRYKGCISAKSASAATSRPSFLLTIATTGTKSVQFTALLNHTWPGEYRISTKEQTSASPKW
ncbi:hypothetical protein ACROYT_G015018 [Oculina patagonica]